MGGGGEIKGNETEEEREKIRIEIERKNERKGGRVREGG